MAVLGDRSLVVTDREPPSYAQVHIVVLRAPKGGIEAPNSLEDPPPEHHHRRRPDVAPAQQRQVVVPLHVQPGRILEGRAVGPYVVAAAGDKGALRMSLKLPHPRL